VKHKLIILIGFLFLTANLWLVSDSYANRMYRFSGGPSGGTFQYYASAISTLAKKHNIRLLASSSGGSIENIRLTNSGKASFAISFSGHIFHARNGRLKKDSRKYLNVMVLGYFFGAPAQLIVNTNSGITTAQQLNGKRIGVGNAGSGAAENCELFFTELGLWKKIKRNYLGYRQAADAFKNKQLDAFWVFSGFPNASVIEAALQNDLFLINTYDEAQKIGMFKKYPFFQKVVIPAGTYKGVTRDTISFEDSALWIANKKVSADIVYKLLRIVYSNKGLSYLARVHMSAKAMSIEKGVYGIVTPLHPGAEKFWKEQGVLE